MLEKKQTRRREIKDYLPEVYTEYAMSVITDRALPDARDGLKPVQRRILYSMWEQGLTADKPHKKSARTVGEVLGKYHPHGDQAVYAAMVRMGQDFSLKLPLIDGQGNFGSIDGDPPAAMRYTESRLTDTAMEFFVRLKPEGSSVDWQKNFDGSTVEPEVLPVPFPNLLVNGSSGIAVGMSTDIPPHNLDEILSACIQLIDLKEPKRANWTTLLDKIKGPDYPTGGEIFVEPEELEKIYKTGEGQFELAGHVHIEDLSPKRQAIVIDEMPYGVNKSKLIDEMVDLAKSDGDPGISTVRDESDKQGLRLVVECRLNKSASIILNNLYEKTSLKVSQRVAFLALVDGVPRQLDLKEIIINFNNFMDEVLVRNTKKRREMAKDRLHIVRGLIKALVDIARVIEIVTQSENGKKASSALQHEFDMTEIQAEAVLDRRIRTLTNMKQIEIEQERDDLVESIKEYDSLLASEKERAKVIKGWYKDIRKKYGEKRDCGEPLRKHTRIKHEQMEIEEEDLRHSEPVVLSLYPGGYIRRDHGNKKMEELPVVPQTFFETDTLSEWLVFDSSGSVFSFLPADIPDTHRDKRGVPFQQINSNIRQVAGFIPASARSAYVFTKNGYVKKLDIAGDSDFSSIRPSGIKYIDFKEEDNEVVAVIHERNNADIIAVSENGKGIRFSSEDIRSMGRGARGVVAKKGEPLAGATLARDDEILLLRGKDTCAALNVSEIEAQNRGGKGRFLVRPGKNDRIREVLASSTPAAVKNGKITPFDSRSQIGGHGARKSIDYFVTVYHRNNSDEEAEEAQQELELK
ncbi:MAG: DNA topoisomerase (ATP-hydrolyzing) subunit A [bacterium]